MERSVGKLLCLSFFWSPCLSLYLGGYPSTYLSYLPFSSVSGFSSLGCGMRDGGRVGGLEYEGMREGYSCMRVCDGMDGMYK